MIETAECVSSLPLAHSCFINYPVLRSQCQILVFALTSLNLLSDQFLP